jgi:hypothetical protein
MEDTTLACRQKQEDKSRERRIHMGEMINQEDKDKGPTKKGDM